MADFSIKMGMGLSFTLYRDTQGPFASQIILWQTLPNLVKEMSLEEYRSAMEKPAQIGYDIRHGGKLLRGDRFRDVKTGKVI
jgi:hypothetical protein